MKRSVAIVLSLALLSTILSVYTILITSRPNPAFFAGSTNSVTTTNGPMFVSVAYPVESIFLSLSVVGWLLTGYELFAERKKEISHILRTTVSGRKDHWGIYNVFKGKGGARRLTILESLDVPRQRNEVAKMTSTDWKEVDRNIRILESANLIRMGQSGTPYPRYELTEEGQELLKKITSVVQG